MGGGRYIVPRRALLQPQAARAAPRAPGRREGRKGWGRGLATRAGGRAEEAAGRRRPAGTVRAHRPARQTSGRPLPEFWRSRPAPATWHLAAAAVAAPPGARLLRPAGSSRPRRPPLPGARRRPPGCSEGELPGLPGPGRRRAARSRFNRSRRAEVEADPPLPAAVRHPDHGGAGGPAGEGGPGQGASQKVPTLPGLSAGEAFGGVKNLKPEIRVEG